MTGSGSKNGGSNRSSENPRAPELCATPEEASRERLRRKAEQEARNAAAREEARIRVQAELETAAELERQVRAEERLLEAVGRIGKQITAPDEQVWEMLAVAETLEQVADYLGVTYLTLARWLHAREEAYAEFREQMGTVAALGIRDHLWKAERMGRKRFGKDSQPPAQDPLPFAHRLRQALKEIDELNGSNAPVDIPAPASDAGAADPKPAPV